MKILVVFDHPRRDSFCGAVLDALLEGLAEAGHVGEVADLRAEGFDPRLPIGDEPDWSDPDKAYTLEVLTEQARIAANEALAFVFPVWWWSLPATTKGWIDRVWNNGWAYGDRKLPHSKALLIGTASADAESYAKRRYDEAMRVQLVTGIMDYCGIPEAELHLLYDVIASDEIRRDALVTARRLGATYFGQLATTNEFNLAPPVPMSYPRLTSALTSMELSRARELGFITDEPLPSRRLTGRSAIEPWERPSDSLDDWRHRMLLVWFCYLVEEYERLEHPNSAIEDILGELHGGPSEFDRSLRPLATVYAGAGAWDPPAPEDRKREMAFLRPYYDRAVALLATWRG